MRNVKTFVDRTRGLLALGFLGAIASCVEPEYVGQPFRCTAANPSCPTGYHCDTQQCVRDGTTLPVFLSSEIDEYPGTFVMHPYDDGVAVCWRNSAPARARELWLALVGPNGNLDGTPVLAYSEGVVSASADGWAATCGVVDDKISIIVLRPGASLGTASGVQGRSVLQRHFEYDPAHRDQPPAPFGEDESFVCLMCLGIEGLTQVTASSDGHSMWATYPHDLTIDDQRLRTWETSITAGTVNHAPLDIPLFTTLDFVRNMHTLPMTSGQVIVAEFTNSSLRIEWAPRDGSPGHTIDIGEVSTRTAVPLATNGSALAIGSVVGRTDVTVSWRIDWIVPGATAAEDRIIPGPTVDFASGVDQPGGYYDATTQSLLIAAAAPVAAGAASNHVSFFSTPWMQAGAVTTIATREKTSSLVPRRLLLLRNGDNLFSTWSELIPASAGRTEYSTLYTATIPVRQ